MSDVVSADKSCRSCQQTIAALAWAIVKVAGICVAAAVFASLGVVGFACTLAAIMASLLIILRSATPQRSLTWVGFVWLAGFIVLLVVDFFEGPVSRARESARRTQCHWNLRHIALALEYYHESFGSFPPAFVSDDASQPLLSWRVLILPFIEESTLFEKFDLSKPWNDPDNRDLLEKMPSVYACPSDTTWHSKTSSYVAVVGPETVWAGAAAIERAAVGDGLQNTIQVVELANSDIPWTAPFDLSVAETQTGINPASGRGISSHHSQESGLMHRETGVNAAFADGKVRLLPADLQPDLLGALLTRAGGEHVDPARIYAARLDARRALPVFIFALMELVFAAGVCLRLWRKPA